MTRRSRKSNAEEWVDILAVLPWWGCLLFALIGFVMFHRVATSPLPVVSGKPEDMTALMSATVFHGIAAAAQVIVPMICIVAAGVSFARRRRRSTLFDRAATSSERDVLDGMTWSEFELLVGEAYRRRGYDVEERGGSSPDGGVDLVLRRDGASFFVQCKQWKACRVGVDVVRQLKGVIAAQGVRGGFVITSGRFTDEARGFARLAGIELVDGIALHALIRAAKRDVVGSTVRADRPAPSPSLDAANRDPGCPACGSPMARRTARRGAHAGRDLWGCTAYPACRGTRPVESAA